MLLALRSRARCVPHHASAGPQSRPRSAAAICMCTARAHTVSTPPREAVVPRSHRTHRANALPAGPSMLASGADDSHAAHAPSWPPQTRATRPSPQCQTPAPAAPPRRSTPPCAIAAAATHARTQGGAKQSLGARHVAGASRARMVTRRAARHARGACLPPRQVDASLRSGLVHEVLTSWRGG